MSFSSWTFGVTTADGDATGLANVSGGAETVVATIYATCVVVESVVEFTAFEEPLSVVSESDEDEAILPDVDFHGVDGEPAMPVIVKVEV